METLKDEAIALQRESRFEQVQTSLERLVLVHGFAAQPQMQRCVNETFPFAIAKEIVGVSGANHEFVAGVGLWGIERLLLLVDRPQRSHRSPT